MREPRPAAARDDAPALGLDNLLAGFRFMRRTPVLLAAITLDLFAVLFGGAVALLPIYAKDILHVGPSGGSRAQPGAPSPSGASAGARIGRATGSRSWDSTRPASAIRMPSASGANSASSWKRPFVVMARSPNAATAASRRLVRRNCRQARHGA